MTKGVRVTAVRDDSLTMIFKDCLGDWIGG